MDVCGLSKARPILCKDSPAFQRCQTSARCATESSTYFPCVVDTTFEQKSYIRCCCIDPLRTAFTRTRVRYTRLNQTGSLGNNLGAFCAANFLNNCTARGRCLFPMLISQRSKVRKRQL